MAGGLEAFLDAVEKQTSDTRFNDPAYLAAKYIVYIATQTTSDKDKPRAFTGVAPAMPTDTDLGQCFTYAVVCDIKAWPPVRPEFRKIS